jgi:hypothetical protein
MTGLHLSVATEWRLETGSSLSDVKEWERIRGEVLERDGYTCVFCGFTSPSFMEVHHLEGKYYDQSGDNLATMCPFCHACHHIGFAGINGRGKLIELDRKAFLGQEKINRFLLDSIWKKGSFEYFRMLEERLPVREDHGAKGLVMLADIILDKKKKNGETVPPDNLIFMPVPEKFDICKFILRRRETWL